MFSVLYGPVDLSCVKLRVSDTLGNFVTRNHRTKASPFRWISQKGGRIPQNSAKRLGAFFLKIFQYHDFHHQRGQHKKQNQLHIQVQHQHNGIDNVTFPPTTKITPPSPLPPTLRVMPGDLERAIGGFPRKPYFVF